MAHEFPVDAIQSVEGVANDGERPSAVKIVVTSPDDWFLGVGNCHWQDVERFTAARLCQLQADMTVEGRRASAQISELRHLLHWFNSRRNPLFLPVAILRMWDVRYAFKLEAWRACSICIR